MTQVVGCGRSIASAARCALPAAPELEETCSIVVKSPNNKASPKNHTHSDSHAGS